MSATLTTYDDVLKDYYTEQRLVELFEQDAPLLALMPKATKFPGESMPIPVRYGIAQGINSQIGTARTLSSSTSALFDRFTSVRYKKYLFARVDGETLHATKDDEGAFIDALTAEIDSVLLGGKRRAAYEAYREGWGCVGVINSDTGSATTTVTLANIDDVTIWEKGMTVVFSSALNSATLRGSGAALTVSAVNRATGVITFSAAVTTITSVTSGDYMFIQGERHDSATPTRRVTPGLAAWLPQTSPATDDDFLGCNRSLDPTRLAGQRVSATSVPLEEALISGNVQVGREGGKVGNYFMSFTSWARLEKGLGTRVRYSDVKSQSSPTIGFKAIDVSGPGGTVKCIADAFCVGNKVFGLDLKSWKYRFIDKMFMNRGEGTDNLKMLRIVDEDTFESAWAHYGAIQCDAPGHNVTLQVAS
jgi:hypothetical protein